MKTINWEPFNDSTGCDEAFKRANYVTVRVALPGIQPDSVEICIEDHMITVEGRPQSEPVSGADTDGYGGEITDCLRWSIVLPVPVLSKEAEAILENEMLVVTMPKSSRGDAGPRRLKPRAAVRTMRK